MSVSVPHLRDGAIKDFDEILQAEGENLDIVKIKTPYTYTIGKTTIRFIGADKIGGVLGAQRDILFINEANLMKWKIVHQLIQRTSEAVFFDYNPSAQFWIDTEGVSSREGAKVIHSTFLDNVENLSEGQLTEFMEGKKKHDEELAKGVQGHWYNWFRVFGLGIDGIVEGAIFNNWSVGEFDESIPFMYLVDFGYKDPFTLTKAAFDKKASKLYIHELIYKSFLSPKEITDLMDSVIEDKNSLIIADSADPTQIRGIKNAGFNIRAVKKDKIITGITHLQDWEIIITSSSDNAINEFSNYVWLDKRGEVPIDDYNHIIDAVRYGEKYHRLKKR